MSLLKNIAIRTRRAVRESSEGQDYRDSYSDNYFMSKVMSMDSQPETSRVGSSYVHVSSLIGMCVRKYLLAYVSQAERTETVKSSMRLVWALGRAAETHVRSQFIKAVNYEGVVGMWKCKCGHLKVEGLYDDTMKCPRCTKKAKEYTEAVLFDHEARIVGSPDLIYIRPDNKKLMVVECKSMNKKDFEVLTEPKVDHILQAMAYNKLLSLNGGQVDEYVTILYVCKDYQFSSPYKEFRVSTSRIGVGLALLGMWGRARTFTEQKKNHDEGKEVKYPDRLSLCISNADKTPTECSFSGMCFSVRQ